MTEHWSDWMVMVASLQNKQMLLETNTPPLEKAPNLISRQCTFTYFRKQIGMWKGKTCCSRYNVVLRMTCSSSREKLLKSSEILIAKTPKLGTRCWRRFWDHGVSRDLTLRYSIDIPFAFIHNLVNGRQFPRTTVRIISPTANATAIIVVSCRSADTVLK
jgi:hypothetical protein